MRKFRAFDDALKKGLVPI